jgi:hypothetical protein
MIIRPRGWISARIVGRSLSGSLLKNPIIDFQNRKKTAELRIVPTN